MIKISKQLLLNDPAKLLLYSRIRKIEDFTQLKYAGLCQMHDLIHETEQKGIEGDVVEMGCGRGGCGAFMASTIESLHSDRMVWLFDSFEGISEPSEEKDFRGSNKESWKIKKGYLKVSEESVRQALKVLGVSGKSVRVVKGWFNESLPKVKNDIRGIAILRLDADLYEPTMYCLDELYDKVALGVYIVIDDYRNWVGTRKALYEFFAKRDISPFIQIYPYGGVAYFKKEE